MLNKEVWKIRKYTLKQLRVNSKKTQEKLAKVIDKSISAYNMIENGKRKPSLEDALKIAKFYGVKVEQINFFANDFNIALNKQVTA